MTGLSVAGAALIAAELGLLAWSRTYLGIIAGLLASACFLTDGIIKRSPLLIGISAGGIALVLAAFWWQGPRGRKRAKKELGDESRQLRDGLLRRMRQRVITRPGWSPSR